MKLRSLVTVALVCLLVAGLLPAHDVEECRQTLRDAGSHDTKILQLLMYGDLRGGYQPSAYLVGLDEVNRLPFRISAI